MASSLTNRLSAITQAPAGMLAFIRQAREELKKVSWPSRETTVRFTGIVIVSSLALGLLTGGIDYLLTIVVEATLN